MRLLALETVSVNYPADQWLQIFTDGSYIEKQANGGVGVYSELFTFFEAAEQNRSAFEAEIGAIKIAVGQLCCPDTKFINAVIRSDSQSAIQSIGNSESLKTAEIHECKKRYQLFNEKNKSIVLQWISGHCSIIGTLAKKRTTILQAIGRPISFYTMKT
nr:reverse transcriptase [Hymenolepis microstoma]